jgi:hypothetical protein
MALAYQSLCATVPDPVILEDGSSIFLRNVDIYWFNCITTRMNTIHMFTAAITPNVA